MNLNEYQELALRTWQGETERDRILHAAMGMVCESAEAGDHIKKHAFMGHILELDKVRKEIGDTLYYCAVLAHELGFRLENVAQVNIEKLCKRFPDGFCVEASVERKE